MSPCAPQAIPVKILTSLGMVITSHAHTCTLPQESVLQACPHQVEEQAVGVQKDPVVGAGNGARNLPRRLLQTPSMALTTCIAH